MCCVGLSLAVVLVAAVAAVDAGSNPVVSTHPICPETFRMRGKWAPSGSEERRRFARK
jgi:hypothetical protein